MTALDHPDVLRMNAASVHFLSPLTPEQLESFVAMATFAPVVELDGRVVAFAIAHGPGVDYDSRYYRWWAARRDDFLYLDRIVVDESARGRRIGSMIYEALDIEATTHGRVLAEVNTIPLNEPSLAFHDRQGFVRHDVVGDDDHQVVMVEKVLGSGAHERR